jgi:hypothetical protein
MQLRLTFSFTSRCADVRENGLVRSVACDHFHATGCARGTSASLRTTNIVMLSYVIQILPTRNAAAPATVLRDATIFRYQAQQCGQTQTGTDLPKEAASPHIRCQPWPSTRCLHPLLALIQRESSSSQIYYCDPHFWLSVWRVGACKFA